MVASTPLAPLSGTETSAATAQDWFLKLGAEPSGMRIIHPGVVSNLGAPARETGPDSRIESRRETRIERINVVFLCLYIEGLLKFLELGGILVCNVIRLAEVLIDVIEFPLEIVGVFGDYSCSRRVAGGLSRARRGWGA